MTPSTMEVALPASQIAATGPSGTFEDLILGVWEELAARGVADCPVCHGPLERSGCSSCDSQLS